MKIYIYKEKCKQANFSKVELNINPLTYSKRK